MTVTPERIAAAVADAYIRANRALPADIVSRLRAASLRETVPAAKFALEMMLKNLDAADPLPICQDTGLALVFVKWGARVTLSDGDLQSAVDKGIARACKEGFLRPSVVSDPLRRVNTGDNTPAVIHTEIVAGGAVEITVAPKGFGSENMTALKMFTPAATRDDLLDFAVTAVKNAGSNPCPPVVIGLGIGGTADSALIDAKKAMLSDITRSHADPFWAEFERDALNAVNTTGIGVQGYGGEHTALGLRVITRPTHIAGLPMAASIGCWVARHVTVKITDEQAVAL